MILNLLYQKLRRTLAVQRDGFKALQFTTQGYLFIPHKSVRIEAVQSHKPI